MPITWNILPTPQFFNFTHVLGQCFLTWNIRENHLGVFPNSPGLTADTVPAAFSGIVHGLSMHVGKAPPKFQFIFITKNLCFEAQVLPVITEVLHLAYTLTGPGELSALTSARVPAGTNEVGICGWSLSVTCFLKFLHHSKVQLHFPLNFSLSSLVAFIPFVFIL